MAGERRGILFETIADVALKEAINIAGIPGTVWWNETPENISVVPDFTIGEDKDRPSHVILVTASGSSKETDKKFWRNAGEMQEVKAQLPGSPAVVNLYFKSVVKAGLSELSDHFYDAILYVDREPYFAPLEQWVQRNLRSSVATREDKQTLLTEAMAVDNDLESSVHSLALTLTQILQQYNRELAPLWLLMHQDYVESGPSPTSRVTNVKHGLAKLMVLEPHIRRALYDNPRSAIRGELPDYVFDLFFFSRSLVGARLTDQDIGSVVQLLGPEKCEAVIAQAPEAMYQWIKPLRDLSIAQAHLDFVLSHYEQFMDANSLRELLVECYEDPVGLSGISEDESVWVYEIIVSLLKAKSGKLQGYGLSQLAQDAQVPEFGQGGFLIPPFVQREKELSQEHLTALAIGLSRRFSQDIEFSDITHLREKIVEIVVQENLTIRLIPYRNFEPLLWMLESSLQNTRVEYSKVLHGGWINEVTNSSGTTATTPFIRVGNTLIHWKTVSDAGKGHKKKELSGRARNVKYQYHPETQTFTRREDVEHLALIVDGTFDDSDLQVLTESGWDIIVYPDEIERLIDEIT